MPFDRYMRGKSRSEITRFGLVGGVRADTSPGLTPVLDSVNVFPSPDGTEMLPRDGVEIRKRYNPTTDPPGRKALIVENAPPDIPLGFLFMVVDTSGGRNVIESANFMRDRSQLPLQSDLAYVYPDSISQSLASIFFAAFRVGNLETAVTVFYRTVDGTAVAGVDYTAESGTLTISPGDVQSFDSVEVSYTSGVNKYFTFEFYNASPGAIISDGTNTGGATGIYVVNIP